MPLLGLRRITAFCKKMLAAILIMVSGLFHRNADLMVTGIA
jgi:hypothetical protein